MTRKQLYLAAKLYSLALLAHADTDDESEDVSKMKALAAKKARTALCRMGVSPADLVISDDCVTKAKELT